jgi:hypothetical protein
VILPLWMLAALPLDPTTVDLAASVTALGVTGLLALGVILFFTGKLRREKEVVEAEEQGAREVVYREALRQEAIVDRKAADERLSAAVAAMKESNDLMRRSLELNERLIDEFVRPSSARTRRTDRARTDR